MLADAPSKVIVILALGTVALAVAVLRPRWLQALPGMRWFMYFSASQFSLIVISVGVILFGIHQLGLIPKPYVGLVLVLWAFAFVAGALHDFTKSEDE